MPMPVRFADAGVETCILGFYPISTASSLVCDIIMQNTIHNWRMTQPNLVPIITIQ